MRTAQRLATRRRLRDRDRTSAQLARAHAATVLLGEVAMLVELGWAAGRTCSGCVPDRHAHGGATGSGVCVVGAVRVTANEDADAVHLAVDLLWHQLHQGGPRRTVNWHSPTTRHALQVRDLLTWNDHRERSAQEAAALVRATLRTAQICLEQVRTERVRTDSQRLQS